jgi:acetyl esterase/lipase
MPTKILNIFLLLMAFVPSTTSAAEHARMVEMEYARVGATSLKLDLHSCGKQQGPLILWVHGGAWRSGSKSGMPLTDLGCAGFPVASVDYRLSTEAKFPAQVHDIKAAIRFLRAKATDLNINAKTIVVAGDSAGGHLAALVGVTNDSKPHEGEVGEHRDQSSSVQGIFTICAGANLTSILDQSTPHGLKVRVPALDLLLGGQPTAVPDLARLASPVFHVDPNDPPLLLFHGEQDYQMPINQSLELHGAYKKAGADAELEIVYGAGHGGKAYYEPERLERMKRFLREELPAKK